jgi:hypothetical protein
MEIVRERWPFCRVGLRVSGSGSESTKGGSSSVWSIGEDLPGAFGRGDCIDFIAI